MEYGLSGYLKNALEIEEWCRENYGNMKIYERKLPSPTSKDEYEKKLGEKLNNIRMKKIKQYEGIELKEIEDEEDRQIVEIIRRLDREYNYRKIRAQTIGEAGAEIGLTDVKKCDEAEEVVAELLEKAKEGEIQIDG